MTWLRIIRPRADVIHLSKEEWRRAVRRGFRLALLGYLVLAGGIILALGSAYRLDQKQCEDSRVNRMAIRQTIIVGDPTLLRPGDPGYDYWQAHPIERQRAHDRIYAVDGPLSRFPPIHC